MNEKRGTRYRCAAVLGCLALLGIQAGTAAFATDCVAEAARSLELNLSAGVYTEQAQVSTPLKLKLPAGTDPQRYAACLNLTEPNPAREVIQAVQYARDCREQATRTRLVEAESVAGQRIRSDLDEARYAACVRHEIDVEVVAPEP